MSKPGPLSGEGITADDMKKLRWLKPQLVAEVRFTEWTSYGLLRHATFAGLRDDKEPAELTREQNLDAQTIPIA